MSPFHDNGHYGKGDGLRRFLALAQRPARRNLAALRHRVQTLIFAIPAYSLTLVGLTPARLLLCPGDPWPGDADNGRAILEGHFSFAGRTIRTPVSDGPPPNSAAPDPFHTLWLPLGMGPRWRAELHAFAWLRDLRVAGGDSVRHRARDLVASWIAHHQRWDRLAWRADILAARLSAWLSQYEFLSAGADAAFNNLFFKSLSRQARHLARIVPGPMADGRLIGAAKGLIYCGVCLPGGGRYLKRALRLLEKELVRQVLGDGGHFERSPSLQLSILRDLVDIRATLIAAHRDVPATLQSAIDRMAPMGQFFRHGDGGVALFDDSNEEQAWLIDMVLTRADAKGKPLASAPHSGFERLTNNRTLIIADVGAPPPPGAQSHTHAGTLSFEMSLDKERLIGNCGGPAGLDGSWRQSMRTTAAHSTLSVEDTNSTEIFEDGGDGGFLGRRPRSLVCRRKEEDGAIWIDASHDGYLGPFGLIHRRRLYLSADGEDLRGEDTLSAPKEGRAFRRKFVGRRFAVRFHLHPRVQASLVQDGAAALLRLPSGAGWQMKVSGGVLGLEESVYLGVKGEIKRAEQIVIRGNVAKEGAEVKWALTRVAGKS